MAEFNGFVFALNTRIVGTNKPLFNAAPIVDVTVNDHVVYNLNQHNEDGKVFYFGTKNANPKLPSFTELTNICPCAYSLGDFVSRNQLSNFYCFAFFNSEGDPYKIELNDASTAMDPNNREVNGIVINTTNLTPNKEKVATLILKNVAIEHVENGKPTKFGDVEVKMAYGICPRTFDYDNHKKCDIPTSDRLHYQSLVRFEPTKQVTAIF